MDLERTNDHLKNLKGLFEMHLSSKLLFEEIFGPLKKTMKESEINKLLSEKTGKGLNSIYRDKNTGVAFNAVMFLRYWKALLEIIEENGLNKSSIPSIEDLIEKYKNSIEAISSVEDAKDLEGAINSYFPLIVEIIIFYEKNPLPADKTAKREMLEILKARKDIQDALILERMGRMTKID
ncbi:hypothetical protein [Domibacillus iocasae]|uniref:Uncharacterized protein n=1 Tax=Domibacillus iocasae TaxID=1714016 RepID=A0A1E7DK18_9BACI|nr:hypothetical protein [Domibacillus iocasae]OES43345.1 hypothetical protein BA724_13930 [Domibacillus iocasae]